MDPRITVITLTVENLDRAVAFYRDGLGWASDGIVGTELEDGAVAFFDLTGGLKLALWPRASLERDAGLEPLPSDAETPRVPSRAMSLGHNLRSWQEVDATFRRAVAAGASPVRPPRPASWGGYAGYIADPDGHLWELVYNPDLIPE